MKHIFSTIILSGINLLLALSSIAQVPDCKPYVSYGKKVFCEGDTTNLTIGTNSLPNTTYRWFRDTSLIVDAKKQSLVVNQSGSYRLETTYREEKWGWDMNGGPDSDLNDIQFLGNTGWIVGNYGILLKTTDGYSWDTIATNRQDHFTAVRFVNTQIGWVGGSHGLLLKSTNGGSSWDKLNIPVSGAIQKIRFLNENTGYVLADRLLFKTTNGGLNWQSMTLPNSFGLEDIAFVDVAYGWIASNNQIYKTENGGDSWTLQSTFSNSCNITNAGVQKIWALDRNNCWALCYNGCSGGSQSPNYVLRTLNGGNTWESYNLPVNSFFPTLSYLTPSAIIFNDAQNGYIVGRTYGRYFAMTGVNSGVVLKTQNGGQTWSAVYNNAYDAFPVAISFQSVSQGYVVGRGGLIVGVNNTGGAYNQNPQNRTFLPLKSVGGTAANIFAVGGRPRTWGENGAHPDSKAVTILKKPGQPWVKTETGFDFDPLGWPSRNGYTTTQVKFKSNQFGWKVGYRIMSFTKDGGNTWQSLFGNINPIAYTYIFDKAYFKSDSTGFVLMRNFESDPAKLSGFSGSFRTDINIPYKDTDDPYNTGMLDLQFINDSIGFITTSNGKLIKTTNGGADWTVQVVRAGKSLQRCFFVNKRVGWVITNEGGILQTLDGGDSWIEQNSGVPNSLNGIYFLSEQDGYVVGADGLVLKTSDGGTSESVQ